MDEGVSEGLPSMQSTSNTGGHAEDDERYHDLLRLATRQVISSKEHVDINFITGCLRHACYDNKFRRHIKMSDMMHYDVKHCKSHRCYVLRGGLHGI